ncbi:unnamed protein product [Pleuronectes platessa]|uniref:Uncharacterized protein n=1 Tax=Pleuronectes platessa TaxID=8262 RepID=A0A9N7UR68_PLEPL|nr:unnamed protein product [Pleuronectes platessa]
MSSTLATVERRNSLINCKRPLEPDSMSAAICLDRLGLFLEELSLTESLTFLAVTVNCGADGAGYCSSTADTTSNQDFSYRAVSTHSRRWCLVSGRFVLDLDIRNFVSSLEFGEPCSSDMDSRRVAAGSDRPVFTQ